MCKLQSATALTSAVLRGQSAPSCFMVINTAKKSTQAATGLAEEPSLWLTIQQFKPQISLQQSRIFFQARYYSDKYI
ncbi:hypothetical protein FGO68_gene5223 [Halteria grandinella]|uniref:Uncharacterized protein n=1 Tax=Halteria grandinella TaxID=5974 RepID=A0A8J8SZZ9_HALGN|nr:hypothetical protein FGO68_gene5223 [Halteria grandinella]